MLLHLPSTCCRSLFTFHDKPLQFAVIDFSNANSGSVASSAKPAPPVQDQQLALSLLCELAVQRASLRHLLDIVLLLLNLWNRCFLNNYVVCFLAVKPI